MRVVITVSLDNRAYQIEEEAYATLRHYMDRAKAGLRDNPDVAEILGDVERAIGEKCAATLRSGKDVVTTEEMAAILQEVGPVMEDPMTDPPPLEDPTAQSTSEPRRLYRQPKGAMVEGVCMGLAEYFEIDVVIPRLIFAILTLASGGLGGGLYLIMIMIVPSREPERPKVRRPWRPSILIAGAGLLLVAVLGFIQWMDRGVAVDTGRFSGASGPMGFVEVLIILGVGGVVVMLIVLAVAAAKHLLSHPRAKE